MAGIRITLKETGQQSIARLWVYNPNEEKEPDYLIHFRRSYHYQGEFGFDWMRKNCTKNCEELKKEYYDCEKNEKVELLKDKEYFVPWLSMFPNQNNVKLLLEIEIINKNGIQEDDYIVLKPTKGISFNPNTIKLSEIPTEEERKKDISNYLSIADQKAVVEIFCNKLEKDVCVDILSSKGKVVGKLNIIANNEILPLKVKFVKVCSKKDLEKLKGKYDLFIEDLKNFIKNRSLNQALIEPKIIEEDFNKLEFINTDDLSKENFITEGIIKYSVASKNIKNKYNLNSFKGIIVFFCYFDNEKSSAGTAECLPLDNPFLFIYKNSASESDLAHEIGHVLGLVHSFGGKEYENVKSQSENNINYYKTLFQDLKKKYKNQDLSKQKQQIDKYISDENKKISEVEELFSKNKYEFSEGQTTNIMDYQEDRKEQKDFFHWQWLVMREEVKKYYS